MVQQHVSDNAARDLRDAYRGPDLTLFFRDLKDSQNKKRKISCKTWSTIQDVKSIISQKIQVPSNKLRLFYGPLVSLPNHRSLCDAGIYKSGETLLLDIVAQDLMYTDTKTTSPDDIEIARSMTELTPRALRYLIQQARRGLSMGLKPELVLDGSGGTYYLKNAQKCNIAVFKPADEEPYAENNPRGYVGTGGSLRDGIAPGHACLREVAAYLLDHEGFAQVPQTTLCVASHPAFHVNGARLNVSQGGASVGSHSLRGSKDLHTKKVGSLQAYCHSECTMDDLSPSMIDKDEIHKIAILDIRLMNADRNSANLLCRRNEDDSIELVPIDHGFCLRSVCNVSWMDWCWLDWPQLKQPLSPKLKEYVLKINIDADARLLKETLNIQGPAIDYFRASNKILKEGVKNGLSLYEIACICCRNDDLGEEPSKLEILTEMAKELATSAVENGRWHHSAASRAIADQLSPEAFSRRTSISSPAGSRMIKSASSAEFHNKSSRDMSNNTESPNMVQSSGSDSSSDVGGGDVADADEVDGWAKDLVEGVTRNCGETPIKRRLLEDDSEASLSSSPKGFWFVRPGEQKDSGDSDSEGDVTWSPYVSPRMTQDIGNEESLMAPSMAPSVSFAMDERFLLPPTVPMASEGPARSLSLPRRSSSGMSRSQSFAAFGARGSSTMGSLSEHSISDFGKQDSWKAYFSKFVDLVTAAAVVSDASIAMSSSF